MRMGKKKQPSYRIVATDSRSPRDGRFIEIVGHYNPRQEPSALSVDNDKAVAWLRQGAQPSDTVRRLLQTSGAWAEFKGEAPPPAPASDTDEQAAS
jgi:small subunit ribosomal protein S16